MKRPIPFLTAFAAVTLCLSCSDSGSETKTVVPLVREILSDRKSDEFALLAACSVPDKYGAVFILGSEEECRTCSDALSGCDERDNVSGAIGPDGLLDFSGERICSVVDFAGGDYSSYPSRGLEDSLSTQMVRLSLLAIDTLCYVSPYDLKGLVAQPRAKIVILASSFAEAYGLYDVDSLFSASGCGVRVLNPLAAMKKAAKSSGARNVGVLAPAARLSSGLYSGCVAFHPASDGRNPLLSFLDRYAASGATDPLDALIVDDCSVACDSLESALSRIRSVMNEESVVYSPLLSDTFRIIDPRKLIASECFDILRKNNLFAHRITLPKTEKYMTVRRPEMVLIPFNERYISTD